MNAIVEVQSNRNAIVQNIGRMSVSEVTQNVIAVQEIMRAVMKPGIHYGQIPGAGEKPTLFKPGAELLCMTFRIGDDYQMVDLSKEGAVRYRVTCIGRHQGTGLVLGQGLGECSSDEEKYKWRKAVCKEEFDETPPTLKRKKFARGKNSTHYTIEQIRTEPADIANTVLKMAAKRAKIAMVLNVTAASDMFSQDMEDLDEVLRESLVEKAQQQVQQAAHDPMLAAHWAGEVSKAPTTDALAAVWKQAVTEIKAAKDMEAYTLVKKATEARATALKAKQQQDQAEREPGVDEDFLAEMDAAGGSK